MILSILILTGTNGLFARQVIRFRNGHGYRLNITYQRKATLKSQMNSFPNANCLFAEDPEGCQKMNTMLWYNKIYSFLMNRTNSPGLNIVLVPGTFGGDVNTYSIPKILPCDVHCLTPPGTSINKPDEWKMFAGEVTGTMLIIMIETLTGGNINVDLHNDYHESLNYKPTW